MADTQTGPWTVLRLLEWTKGHFQQKDVHDPRLGAEVLLAHVLGCERIELYTRFDYEPTQDELTAFREMVKRAANHEPVAYLTGKKEFYSLPMIVTPDVLIPRPETEILVEQALKYLPCDDEPTAWDACTGSGCVAMAIAVNAPSAKVLATDISPEAVAVAQRNADALGLSDRVRCMEADMAILPEAATDWAPFDVITANPPYVTKGDWIAPSVAHEPDIALYADDEGLAMLRRLFAEAADAVKPGGVLISEFSFNQGAAVREIIENLPAWDDATFLVDHQGLERTVVARRSVSD
ncbi:MAG: peptide chain release factor N(5)-glutamine methyltransferase [Phycisphaerae bacterium]